MSDPPVCQCNMFKEQGACWHTGYRPAFQGDLPEPLAEPVPQPELRRRGFLRLLEETDPNAEDIEAIREANRARRGR